MCSAYTLLEKSSFGFSLSPSLTSILVYISLAEKLMTCFNVLNMILVLQNVLGVVT